MDISDAGSDMEENNKGVVITEEKKDSGLNSNGADARINGPCGEGTSYAYKITDTRSWIQTHTIIDISEKGLTEKVAQDIPNHKYVWECLSGGLDNTYGGSTQTKK